MRVKKGGDSYGLRKSIVLFLSQLIIVPMLFDSVYSKGVKLLVIFRSIFEIDYLYMTNLKFG